VSSDNKNPNTNDGEIYKTRTSQQETSESSLDGTGSTVVTNKQQQNTNDPNQSSILLKNNEGKKAPQLNQEKQDETNSFEQNGKSLPASLNSETFETPTQQQVLSDVLSQLTSDIIAEKVERMG
jgi:hypothetical protein